MQEWPEEYVEEPTALSWPLNSPDPNPINVSWDVMETWTEGSAPGPEETQPVAASM